MADGTPAKESLRGEITFKDVLRQIWLGRSIIGLSIALLLVIACLDILVSKPVYQATMMVAPVKALDQINSPDPILNASRLLGGEQDVTRFQIYVRRYTSVDIAAALENDHHLLKRIFARRWDAKDKRWLPSYSAGTLLRRLFGVPAADEPNVFDLRDFLSRNVGINPGTGEELQTITFADADPTFARQLLEWLHQEGERLSKQQAAKEAESNITFIELKLQSVNDTEQRRVLINLLAQQENQLMLSQGGGSYSAQVIEEPAVPLIPFSPNPPLLLGLALIGGFAIGIFANIVILLFDTKAKPKRVVINPHTVRTNIREMLRSFPQA